jgi:hypothetical protein
VKPLPAFLLATVVAACAGTPATNRQASGMPDYQRYVQGPDLSFDAMRVDDWSTPDASHVVVWSAPTRAALVTLFGPCFALERAATIGLESGPHARGGVDAIVAGGERCPIQRIDRLDGRRLRADMERLRAARDPAR